MPARRLDDLLTSALTALPPGPICVAYSGGIDSTALLHALAAMAPARTRGLRAVHVDHQLQTGSARWSEHCRQFAEALEVEFVSLPVRVARTSGLGLEAAARRARYDAITASLGAGEILALAHHRDDQAETVLLKLLRGAGPEGLGAMRTLRPLGRGLAWRPLLDVPQAELKNYLQRHQLGYVLDPSNADPALDRNYLRLEVLPRLQRRWPEAEASIALSANWARVAADYIDAEAERALARIQGADPATLLVQPWLDLPEALRDPVLRRWLRQLDLPEPSRFQVAELVRQLTDAAQDRQPSVRWRGAQVRRYRDLLFALAPLPSPPTDWEAPFDGSPLQLPAGTGSLRLLPQEGGERTIQLTPPWRVRFRRGGEGLRLPGAAHTRELRDLFQERGIPPWQRARLPLMFTDADELAAVGDVWIGACAAPILAAQHCVVAWSGPDVG